MAAPSVTLNQGVIEASWAGAKYADEASRVSALVAFQLGWAIEELVALSELVQLQAQRDVSSATSIPAFPADIGQSRTAAEKLDRALKQSWLLAEKLQGTGDKAAGERPAVFDLTEALIQGKPVPRADIDQAVANWDSSLTDELLGQYAGILTAYETGKALNLTYWKLWFSMSCNVSPMSSRSPGESRGQGRRRPGICRFQLRPLAGRL